MKQLGVLDSAFINLEQPKTPQHIGGFGIYDPSTAPGGMVRFKQVIKSFERRMSQMPIFRTRLVEVPLGLDRPYWVVDDHFDVEFHLRHISLPQPGDWRQLCILLARLHARPIDMSRPLWECYIIEGLDNITDVPEGSFAIYTKMHHSLIDGAGSTAFMSALHDLEPVPLEGESENDIRPEEFKLPEHAIDEDKRPTNTSLLTKAIKHNYSGLFQRSKRNIKLAKDLVNMARDIRSEELPPLPSNAPKTRFDEPVGPYRVFDAALFDLEKFKEIRRSTGTTINDVAMGVVSGALRKYLDEHGELPDESLIAAMPVNMRERVGENGDNNQVGSILSTIHSDISNPLERLEAIRNSVSESKKYIQTPMANIVSSLGAFNPWFGKRFSKFYSEHEMTRRLPMGTCSVVTNVMGPPFPLYCAGAKMVQYHCLGLLTPGGGLFQAVFSMNGNISIAVTADREQMPDPAFYKQCLIDSFEELYAAAQAKAKEDAKAEKAAKEAEAKKPATKAKAKAKPKAKKAAAKASTSTDKEDKAPAKAKTKAKAKPKAKKASAKADKTEKPVTADAKTTEIVEKKAEPVTAQAPEKAAEEKPAAENVEAK